MSDTPDHHVPVIGSDGHRRVCRIPERVREAQTMGVPSFGRISARRGLRLLVAAVLFAGMPSFAHAQRVLSSLLLLIDTSGSMDGEIGNGNAEIKMDAAKAAAIAAVDRALANSATEVAVLAFSGNCQNPVSRQLQFTTDVDRLTRFINGLQPGGGTPMAEAVLVANHFMQATGNPGARSQMIVLLADGDNDCGDVAQAMAQLKNAGIVFRHETVGFGIAPNSGAARDLRQVATASGGEYHHAASATQLADVFMEFVDTFTVIDMLGMFGSGTRQTAPASGSAAAPQTQGAKEQDTGRVTSLLGMFDAPAEKKTAGALAIDSLQGKLWGWAAGYATIVEAQERALAECGTGCRIVMSFADGCAAYAADQAKGSTARGWGHGFETSADAHWRALDECAKRGGADCIVRAWACGGS